MARRQIPVLLAVAGAVLLSSCAAAPALPGDVLHCRADGEFVCEGDTCRFRPDEAVQVEFVLAATQDGGNLCTWTYCRSFSWLPVPGDRSLPRKFGPVLSASSGSTDDLRDLPVVDYHLWLSDDRDRFALVPLPATGATWVGDCRRGRE